MYMYADKGYVVLVCMNLFLYVAPIQNFAKVLQKYEDIYLQEFYSKALPTIQQRLKSWVLKVTKGADHYVPNEIQV